jgi:hypothetical protein
VSAREPMRRFHVTVTVKLRVPLPRAVDDGAPADLDVGTLVGYARGYRVSARNEREALDCVEADVRSSRDAPGDVLHASTTIRRAGPAPAWERELAQLHLVRPRVVHRSGRAFFDRWDDGHES